MISAQATRSIDGIQHPRAGLARHGPMPKQPLARPIAPATPPRPARAPLQRPFQITSARSAKPNLWSRLQLPAVILAGMLAGFFVQSLLFGITAIVLYGALALAFRVPSRATFMLAFMALVTVVVLLLFRPGTALAGNFATYTFLLLVTGVIALAIEARPPKRRKRRKNPVRG